MMVRKVHVSFGKGGYSLGTGKCFVYEITGSDSGGYIKIKVL